MSIFAESILTDFQNVDSADFGHSPGTYVKNKTPKDWKFLISKIAKNGTKTLSKKEAANLTIVALKFGIPLKL